MGGSVLFPLPPRVLAPLAPLLELLLLPVAGVAGAGAAVEPEEEPV